MKRAAWFCLAICAALAAAGCAGYHLGPSNGDVAGAKSVRINPFINHTIEPRISEYLNNALRKQVQRDGTFRLDTRGEGDVVVTGSITQFQRSELSYQPNDVLTPRDYTLLLIAQVIAYDRTTGKTNLNRPVAGRTTIRVGADLASAERQAIPLLADDLARNAISALAEGTW